MGRSIKKKDLKALQRAFDEQKEKKVSVMVVLELWEEFEAPYKSYNEVLEHLYADCGLKR